MDTGSGLNTRGRTSPIDKNLRDPSCCARRPGSRPVQLLILVTRQKDCQGKGDGRCALPIALESVLADLAAERIAMHAEEIRGASEVPVRLGEHLRDELLLEL